MKPAEASTDRFWRHADARGDGSYRCRKAASLGIAALMRNLARRGLLPEPQ